MRINVSEEYTAEWSFELQQYEGSVHLRTWTTDHVLSPSDARELAGVLAALADVVEAKR